MRKYVLISSLVLLAMATSACWYSKQQMYATVTNQSGVDIRAVEVDYPGGTYGIPELKAGSSHRKWVAVTPPCKYALKFEDAKGKPYAPKPLEFGHKCPNEVILTIDGSMNVSGIAVAQ